MKKPILITLGVIFTFMLFDSCSNKEENTPTPENNYRLSSVQYINFNGYTEEETYEYDGAKLKRFTKDNNGNTQEVTDYSYSGNVITTLKNTYESGNLQKQDSTEYYFDGEHLVEMKHWARYESDWSVIAFVEFIYAGGKVIEFKETHEIEPVSRGYYIYEGNQILKYEAEFFHEATNQWVILSKKTFTHEGEILVQQNTGLSDSENKITYEYAESSLKRSNFYGLHQTEWYLQRFSEYNYDAQGNLDKIIQKEGYDNSFLAEWDYSFEEGESCYDHILYLQWPNPGMRYPKPM